MSGYPGVTSFALKTNASKMLNEATLTTSPIIGNIGVTFKVI